MLFRMMCKKTHRSPVLLAPVMMLAAFMMIASKPAQSYGESNGAADPATPSAQSYTYSGKHSAWVHKLLTRVGGWQCPTNDSESGTPPKVKSDTCMRDSYVAAAVLYAWAAECYARKEEDSKAEAAAVQMYENLKSAQGFCSDAPSFAGAGECDTMRIYRCGEL